MKKFLGFIKNSILEFLFLILGIWLGYLAARINKATVGGYILLILISVLFTFGLKILYLQTNPAKVIGLFIGFALSYPIAYSIQYVVTFIKFIIGKAKWFFGIPIIGPICLVALISIVGYTLYFIVDSIVTSKGVKK